MSSYGAYTKTSYGAQGGEADGGFMYGGSQQGSQGGGKSYQDESLRPVTIKQLIDAEEAYPGGDFRIDGANVTQVTFVGQVRTVNPQSTNITYKLDDGTGLIEVKKWVDSDKNHEDPMDETSGVPSGTIELDSYVRVWGRLKSFNNKRHVGAHFLRPVTDFNEVNYHLLESTYVHLYTTRGAPGDNKTGGGDGMFVDGGPAFDNGTNTAQNDQISHKLSQCGPQARKMHAFLKEAPGGNEGVHRDVIVNSTGLSVRDVTAAADDLLGHGLVYTTIDDNTWAVLEY